MKDKDTLSVPTEADPSPFDSSMAK